MIILKNNGSFEPFDERGAARGDARCRPALYMLFLASYGFSPHRDGENRVVPLLAIGG